MMKGGFKNLPIQIDGGMQTVSQPGPGHAARWPGGGSYILLVDVEQRPQLQISDLALGWGHQR